MPDLKVIASRPEVKRAVLSDPGGGFLDAVRESDGETVAAVAGFLASTMGQAGDQLGLGALRAISFTGGASACVVSLHGDSIVTAFVEPPAAAAAIERLLDGTDSTLRGR